MFLAKKANSKIESTQYSISFLDSNRVFKKLCDEYDFSFFKKKVLFFLNQDHFHLPKL